MNFTTINKNQISHLMVKGNFDVVKLNHKIDITHFQKIVVEILENNPLMSKDGYDNYLGVGLQYEEDGNMIYDAVQQMCAMENDGSYELQRLFAFFRKRNKLGDRFAEVFHHFEPDILLSRGRILCARPGLKMKWHTDGPHCATLHIPIFTHPNCKILIEKSEYFLPADGSIYLLNAAKTHSLVNQSAIDRIHITFPLCPLNFPNPSGELLAATQVFLEKFRIDPSYIGQIK